MGRDRKGVKKASESSIEIGFSYNRRWCRERLKLKPTPSNLAKADRHRIAIVSAIENGTFNYAITFPNSKYLKQLSVTDGSVITIKEWLDKWLAYKEPLIKASTYHDYRKIVVNILIPQFGGIQLTMIKKHHVKTWASGQSCSNKRISNVLSVLRSALNDAVDDELIMDNPLSGFRYRKIEPPKEDEIDPFTAKEQDLIINAFLKLGQDQAANMIRFAFWSGVRLSELIALKWSDVDWSNRRIHVSRVMTDASRVYEIPKTNKSKRQVKLLGPAYESLIKQKQHTFMHDDVIFHHPRTNKPYSGSITLSTRIWKPAIKLSGVRYRPPKQTRHSYASMMLSSEEPLYWVSNQLGHSSITTTAKIYARYIPSANPEAGSKAVERFTGEKKAALKAVVS